MRITTRELTPELWPDLERLFGPSGACGGCWCMWWRVERGGRLWNETRGDRAHEMMRRLVTESRARGIIAFEGSAPVGWCSIGPREDFPRLGRARSYRRDDVEGVWSINCFFIPRAHRGKGIARVLLAAAVEACERHGARIAEGYPVTLAKDGAKPPAAFAWRGPLGIFEEAGFTTVQAHGPSRPLVRLALRPSHRNV